MSTLRDVARRAGVSVATASRVASGGNNVRPETKARVERAMRDLLYVAPGRPTATGVLGLLLPELANPIFPALAQAIERRAASAGFASILCNTTGSVEQEIEYVHMLLDRGVDGFIFISCEMTNLRGDHGHYTRLMADGARLVFVNGALDGLDVPSVAVDEGSAGETATRHLLELGHRRIGFVAGPAHYLPTREKGRGRERALRAAEIEPNGLVAHGPFSFAGGREAFARLLESPDPPTGVICSSDVMALGVIQEAMARGLDVPGDVSVVGFDGIEAADWTRPALTTMEQPIEQIAATAVDALRTLIDDPERELPHFLFRPKLRRGGSTAPAPTR
jgi:DNA-binding LacI/PurR family transcriptional regulator